MKRRNGLVAVMVAMTMVASMGTSALAATNSSSGVQSKLNKNLKNAQKWAEKQTEKLLPSSKPVTQASAIQQLVATFNKVASWPKGLVTFTPGASSGFEWLDNQKNPYSTPNEWVGLKCVFPGEPASKYATLLGIKPTKETGTVTAKQLAQWVVNWEVSARKVDMKFEPTQNAFQLLKLFSFFYHTDLTKPNGIVTQKDMGAIRNNIIEVSRGWRLVARNRLQILAPLQNVQDSQGGFLDLVKLHQFQKADWPKVYGKLVSTQDSAILTFQTNGNVVYRYERGTGYVPEIGGAFVDKTGRIISEFAWLSYYYGLAYSEQKPQLEAQAFNEPSPEVFNWHQHAPTTKQTFGFNLPNTTQHVFVEELGDMVNHYAAANGLMLIGTPSLAVGYTNGAVKWVQWTTPATNYPSEARVFA